MNVNSGGGRVRSERMELRKTHCDSLESNEWTVPVREPQLVFLTGTVRHADTFSHSLKSISHGLQYSLFSRTEPWRGAPSEARVEDRGSLK